VAETVPEHLVNEIVNGRCVAFIGSGFSAPLAPTWRDLLLGLSAALAADDEELRTAITKAKDALDFERAGQMLSAYASDERSFEQAVQRLLSVREGPHTPGRDIVRRRHKLLSEIPFSAVLTLNMDDVIAGTAPGQEPYRQVLRRAVPWWEAEQWQTTESKASRVIKLHGDANGDPDDNPIVLTRSAYRRRLHEDARYANFLRATLATKTVLYLGFSFTDAYINELRSEVLALIGADPEAPPGYAILDGRTRGWREYFREHEGVEILNYDVVDDDHSGFDRWLEAIHGSTAPQARVRKLLEREGENQTVVWLDPHRGGTNQAGLDWLAAAGAEIEQLDEHGELREADHAGARLLITHHGYRPDAPSTSELVLREVGRWREHPPVIVFASGDHARANRRAALRLGAWEYAHSWPELFELIERLFGRELGRPSRG